MKVGLEIHVQLKSNAKLFCTCPTSYRDAEPNSSICPVCSGQPGSKPMSLNKKAVENLLKIATALSCKVRTGERIHVQRKHYFYPDLPSGYQRTSLPIAEEGELAGVRIREIHIEEDPGRYELKKGLVDFNRSGVALAEIVTEPDMKSAEEARGFLEELSAILGYLEAASEEAGSTRIDANISLEGGNRVEVKNINSFKGVFTALNYEVVRQRNLLERGVAVTQETRHFEESQGITIGLRKKEGAADYRYFPDPDIPPLVFKKEELKELEKKLPELPRQRAARISKQFKIREDDAWVLVAEKELADFFEELAKKFPGQEAAFWVRGPLKKQLNYRTLSFKESGLSKEHLTELFEIIHSKKVTEKVGEQILIKLFTEPESPKKIAEGAGRIGDEAEIEKLVEEVIQENEKAVQDYLAGGEKALNFLSGKVMAKTKGRADPILAAKLLKKRLDK